MWDVEQVCVLNKMEYYKFYVVILKFSLMYSVIQKDVLGENFLV